MKAKELLIEDKLSNILYPKKTGNHFKVTIRFKKHLSKKYEEALALAKKNKYFMAEGEGNLYTVYASFLPEDVEDLHTLFELVKDMESTTIYLNNKMIPYIQDLWLFLMWFYKVK
jgi:hypothetical protein